MHIYEDNVSGKISDDRFRNLSFNYDKEQQELKIKIEQLSKDIENTEKKDTDVTQFILNVKKYTEIDQLTAEILNELIEKIIIHQQEKIDPYVPISLKCPIHSKIPLNLYCLEEKGK